MGAGPAQWGVLQTGDPVGLLVRAAVPAAGWAASCYPRRLSCGRPAVEPTMALAPSSRACSTWSRTRGWAPPRARPPCGAMLPSVPAQAQMCAATSTERASPPSTQDDAPARWRCTRACAASSRARDLRNTRRLSYRTPADHLGPARPRRFRARAGDRRRGGVPHAPLVALEAASWPILGGPLASDCPRTWRCAHLTPARRPPRAPPGLRAEPTLSARARRVQVRPSSEAMASPELRPRVVGKRASRARPAPTASARARRVQVRPSSAAMDSPELRPRVVGKRGIGPRSARGSPSGVAAA